MSVVFRASGISRLAEACEITTLEPDVAFGIVSVPDLGEASPQLVGELLGLEDVTNHLNSAWSKRGYLGKISTFGYVGTLEHVKRPHIDQKKGTAASAPPRAVTLSIARHGVGHVRGHQFNTAMCPDQTAYNAQSLESMRQSANKLTEDQLEVQDYHYPSEVLIIPTLPVPTAHSVTKITETRHTDIWDSILTI